jgi:ribosomal protein S18 acetylase RimI-like enzyme
VEQRTFSVLLDAMAESTFDASLRTEAPAAVSRSKDRATPHPWPSPHIRAANLEDLEELTEVLASSFYDHTGWFAWLYPILKLGIKEDLKQRLKTDRSRYACLAVVAPAAVGSHSLAEAPLAKDIIVGTVEISQRQSWPWQPTSSQYAYISNLAVAQAHRRQGWAAQLLVACEALAATWQLDHLYLHVMEDNPGARRLYRRAGFEVFHHEETLAVWLGLQTRRLLLYKAVESLPRQSAP